MPQRHESVNDVFPARTKIGHGPACERTDDWNFTPLTLCSAEEAVGATDEDEDLEKFADERNRPDDETESEEHRSLARMKLDEGALASREEHDNRKHPYVSERGEIFILRHVLLFCIRLWLLRYLHLVDYSIFHATLRCVDIVPLAVLALGGFVGGFFGSAVGSAGLISLPLLILLGFSPHAAVATTRPAAIVLEFVSAVRYWREGKLTPADMSRGLFLGIFGAIGGAIGAVVIASVSEQTLRLIFAIIICSMLLFLVTQKSWGAQEHPERQKHIALIAVSTLLIGIYGGFFGFTFGTLMMIALTAFGFTFLQSTVLARVIGVFTSLGAAIVFGTQESINYPYAIALSIGFGIGAWFGAGVSSAKGSSYIKQLLIVVVLASVGKLLFDYFSL